MLAEVTNIANRKYQDINFFSGASTANTTVVELMGGIQYQGVGDGLLTDLGQSRPLPITVSGEDAFGALSTRMRRTPRSSRIWAPRP